MLATICDDTCNVFTMQHIKTYWKRWDYSDIPGGGHKKIKGPAHMVEGGLHLRKAHNSRQVEEKDALLKHRITHNALWCNICVLVIKIQMF